MWELHIFKADTFAADGVHLMHFFLTWNSLWTKPMRIVMRCIRVMWDRNPILPAILSPPTIDQALNWAKFSGIFCLWQLWNRIIFTMEICQLAENWCLVRGCLHCFKHDSSDSSLLSEARVPFLLHGLSLISIWLFHGVMIKPLSSLFKTCHTVAERVTIHFLLWECFSRSRDWD